MVQLKILTYNIMLYWPGWGNLKRSSKIAEFLSNGNWDVVVLNEVYSQPLSNYLLTNKDLKNLYPFRTKRLGRRSLLRFDSGIIVLSKHKIRKVKYLDFENKKRELFPSSLFINKGAVAVQIDIENTKLNVVGTHLHFGLTQRQVSTRAKQISELRKFINNQLEPLPTIVLGDFNIMDKEYQYLKQEFDDFIDWWMETGDEENDGYTWSTKNTQVLLPMKDYRYDLILSNEKVKPINTKVLEPKIYPEDDIEPELERFDSPIFKTYFRIAKKFRYLLLPLGISFHTIRWLLGLPVGLKNGKDLSDHYALEGTAEIVA